MATIKILQGVTRITENDNYEFILPNNSSSAVPNSLANMVLEEVYIIVEGNVTDANIYLPNISDFKNGWGCKIYILAKGFAKIIPTQIENKPTNYINYFEFKEIAQGQTGYLHISNFENYALWITDGGFKPEPPEPYTVNVNLLYSTEITFTIGTTGGISGGDGTFTVLFVVANPVIGEPDIYTLEIVGTTLVEGDILNGDMGGSAEVTAILLT